MTEKPSQNEDEYFARQTADLMRQQREQLAAERAETERLTHYMKCPKDGHDLAPVVYHGVTIDRCAHCAGMWLDAGEIDMLASHDDQPGVLGRVLGDVMATLRNRGKSVG